MKTNKETKKQTNKETNDPLKVGFYDLATGSMVAVEEWKDSIELARSASVQMAALYQSGRHRMPSPIWCVWNQKEFASIFTLDDKARDEAFLNKVLALLV
jgi:hypothetical protein